MTVNIVFLIPGFFGFENFGDYAYFAERMGTALRSSLIERNKRVVVWPVPIPPTGSLAQRQLAIGKNLTDRAKKLADRYKDDVVIHLVGHSTGGVDAQLLTLETPLKAQSSGVQPAWHDFKGTDVRWLRDRLRSVISLASPHQGTCFAEDPVARWFTSDSLVDSATRLPAALWRVGPALLDILQEVPGIVSDPALRKLVTNALRSRSTWAFLQSIADSRALVDDLRPSECVGRYTALGASLKLHRRSFVTLAATTPTQHETILDSVKATMKAADERRDSDGDKPAGPDALFALLLDLTSGRTTKCSENAPLLLGSEVAVEGAFRSPQLVIQASGVPQPAVIDRTVSDGVVNTVRQMIDPSDPHEIAGVILGDHFDVIGHYDRELFKLDPCSGEENLIEQKSGLLHSGSQFRDDQFFELMRRMARAIEPVLE